MEIRVEADKQKSIRVKLQSDEVAVRIGKTIPSDRLRPSVESLKAHFEESVTALRSNRSPSFPASVPTSTSSQILEPACPTLSSFHPLLQTLLKLVWDSHLHEFHAVTQTFQTGVSMKVKNTKRLAEYRKTLEASSSQLVHSMHEQAVKDVKTSFRATWGSKLADARDALGASTNDVDELLELALHKASATTRLKPVDLQANVAACLGAMKESFRSRSDRLWEEWTLQMKRHKLVFEGNLKELEFVDKQIANLRGLSELSDAQTPKEEDKETTEASPWKELILVLSSIKLDFDIQLGCISKLKGWATENLEQSRAEATSAAFGDMLKTEEVQIAEAKVQLTRSLEEQKIQRERVLRELRTACNNSLAPVDAVLKSMHLSSELALEAAREQVYLRALHDLKQLCT